MLSFFRTRVLFSLFSKYATSTVVLPRQAWGGPRGYSATASSWSTQDPPSEKGLPFTADCFVPEFPLNNGAAPFSVTREQATSAVRLIQDTYALLPKTGFNQHGYHVERSLARLQHRLQISDATLTSADAGVDGPTDPAPPPSLRTRRRAAPTVSHAPSRAEDRLLEAKYVAAKFSHRNYLLPKNERPPVPEEDPSNPVVLNYYKSTVAEFTAFAREKGIPCVSGKLNLFQQILRAYHLADGTVYIRAKDIVDKGLPLLRRTLHGTSKSSSLITGSLEGPDTPDWVLDIQYPGIPVTTGGLPISSFIHVQSDQSAAAAAALLSDEGLRWTLADSSTSRASPASGDEVALVSHLKKPGLATANSSCIAVGIRATGYDSDRAKLEYLSLAIPRLPTLILDIEALFPQQGSCSAGAAALLSVVTRLFGTSSVRKLLFDGKVVYKFLCQRLKIPMAHQMEDLMLSCSLLEAGQSVRRSPSLSSAVETYLKFPLTLNPISDEHSSPRKKGSVSLTDTLTSVARETAVLHFLAPLLESAITQAGLHEALALEYRCLPAIATMELTGVKFDYGKWSHVKIELCDAVKIAEKRLRDALHWNSSPEGLHKNPNSASQVLEALQALGTDVSCFLKSTSKKSLTDASGSALAPAIEALGEYRRARKLAQSLVSAFDKSTHSETGRIYPTFNQLGATSGRLSCCAPNVQQVPRTPTLRSCFSAAPGHLLVMADFSQIELRIAADLAPDWKMIDAFQQGQDLHTVTASVLKNIPLTSVTKKDRQLAKAMNFGLIYGISPHGLQQYALLSYGIRISLDEARDLRRTFFQHYTGLAQWHQRVLANVRHAARLSEDDPTSLLETRTRVNRRVIFQAPSIARYRQLLNYPVQGTGADIIKEALAQIHESAELKELAARLVMCIHDEVVVETPAAVADKVHDIIVQLMRRAGELHLQHVCCVVDAAVGDNWSVKP